MVAALMVEALAAAALAPVRMVEVKPAAEAAMEEAGLVEEMEEEAVLEVHQVVLEAAPRVVEVA